MKLSRKNRSGKKKKPTAKEIFDKRVSKKLVGKYSDETIDIFSSQSSNYYYNLAKNKYKLKERQVTSLIGFKDEFFVKTLIDQIIQELGFEDKFYCKKVTANQKCGLKSRKIKFIKEVRVLTVGGDCVIFRKKDDRPLMIIECKEYVDMTRMKELIGESRIIKDSVSNSKNLLSGVKFCIFSEVLELTEAWAHLLKNSDLKYNIDEIFIIREGKRKDKDNKPVKGNLLGLRSYVTEFLKRVK